MTGASAGQAAAQAGLPRLIRVCAATMVLGTVLQSSLIPLLPRFAAQHHLGGDVLALVAGAYAVGILLMALPTGALVARHGPRAVLTTAVCLLAASTTLLVLDDGPAALIVSRFVQGGAACMVWGSALPWVADIVPPRRRGRVTGMLLSAGVAGGLIGPLIPLVVDTVGHKATFTGLAVLTALVAVACTRLPAPPRPAGRNQARLRGSSHFRRVLLGGWLVVIAGVVVGTAQVMGALRVHSVGGSTGAIAGLMITATACQTVLNPLVGLTTDRIGHARPIGIGLLAVAVALVAFTRPSTAPAQLVIVLLTLCSTSLVWCPAVALMSGAARDAGLGQSGVFAVVNLTWATGTLLGSAGAGISAAAGYQVAVTAALAAVVVGTAVRARSTLRALPAG